MSFVVVCAVAVLVYIFVRNNRASRQRWLLQLNLPGRWQLRDGQLEMTLSGALDRGDYRLSGSQIDEGQWYLRGSTLTLEGHDAHTRSYEMHLFEAGVIGLEDAQGERRVFLRQADNVVQLPR